MWCDESGDRWTDERMDRLTDATEYAMLAVLKIWAVDPFLYIWKILLVMYKMDTNTVLTIDVTK